MVGNDQTPGYKSRLDVLGALGQLHMQAKVVECIGLGYRPVWPRYNTTHTMHSLKHYTILLFLKRTGTD